MSVRLEEDHPSIVIVGGFDPQRLHPQWFRAEGLLGKLEAQLATVGLVHPDVSDWQTDSMIVQITRDRFLAQAKVESAADALRDFVLGTLHLLDQTRCTALGLNRTMHFDVGGEENWHRIGDCLAPKDLWRGTLRNRPGMRSLQIEDLTRSDQLPGKVIVTVQPSQKYRHGVFFDVNNEIVDASEASTSAFIGIIRNHWTRLLKEARDMAESILNQASAADAKTP